MRHNEAMTVTVLICDGDELARRALGRVVVERGYEVVAEAATAVEAVQLAEAFDASVVVLGNELQGMAGLEVVAELAAAGRRVILVSNDPDALVQARSLGAFYAIERGDLDMFDRALLALGEPIVPGDRRTGIDRRSGTDRREAQDWSQVIRERRTGDERRAGDRRATSASDRAVGA
jgi:CheY-like chemotaxis protein